MRDNSAAVEQITSLKPLNPDNAPDNRGRVALEQFEHGATEHAELVMEPCGRAELRAAPDQTRIGGPA